MASSTDRVIIGGDESLLSAAALERIRDTCAQRDIVVDFVPNLIGLAASARAMRKLHCGACPNAVAHVGLMNCRRYFQYKRVIDFMRRAFGDCDPFAAVPDRRGPGFVRPRRAGRVLAEAYWAATAKAFCCTSSGHCTPRLIAMGSANGNGDYDSWIGNSLRAVAARRTAAIVQCAGRRDVVDRTATAAAAGSARPIATSAL